MLSYNIPSSAYFCVWGQVQNHVSCTASSLALFHLFKGWTQILTFSGEKQIFGPSLRLIVGVSLPFPLWCVWKYIYLCTSIRGRWAGEQPSGGTARSCRAQTPVLPLGTSSLLTAPNERATALESKVRSAKPFWEQEASEKSFLSASLWHMAVTRSISLLCACREPTQASSKCCTQPSWP